MRARYPDEQGYAEHDGVRVFYEVYGEGETTILFIPGWALPGRSFKAQIPFLSRHFRVVAYDPRGTGGSDRPLGSDAYALAEHTADAIAVMDATDTASAVVVGKSRGAQTALALAGEHPTRISGLAFAAPMVPLSPWPPIDSIWSEFEEQSVGRRRRHALTSSLRTVWRLPGSGGLRRLSRRVGPFEAARMFSRQAMLEDWDRFTSWFVTNLVVNERFATKQTDNVIAWLTATGPQAAADAWMGDCVRDPEAARALCARVSCPVLVIHGERDLTVPLAWGTELARLKEGRLIVVPRAGHLPGGRYPVLVNLVLREFFESVANQLATTDTALATGGVTP